MLDSSAQGNPAGIGGKPYVLFLTAHPQRGEALDNWNTELLQALQANSVDVSVLSFLKDRSLLTPNHVAETYTHICLLLLGEYPPHHTSFIKQLTDTIPTAQRLNPRLRVLNGPAMAAWNSDKAYLRDLKNAGFIVPETLVLSSRQPVDYVRFALNTQTHGNPVVIKPSISASGKNTHLVSDPCNLDDKDEHFLRCLLDLMQNGYNPVDQRQSSGKTATEPEVEREDDENEGTYGSILLQEFMPEIKNGEYSLCYIGNELQYTVLKMPKSGGWQVNGAYGGFSQPLKASDVPKDAVDVSRKAMNWLAERFEGEELCYARIDGVVRSDGSFVIMGKKTCASPLCNSAANDTAKELELIEPSLFLHRQETAAAGLDALCKVITRPAGGLDRSVSSG